MRLSKREFRDFVYKVINNMAGGNEHFDYFIDFLLNSVEVKCNAQATPSQYENNGVFFFSFSLTWVQNPIEKLDIALAFFEVAGKN